MGCARVCCCTSRRCIFWTLYRRLEIAGEILSTVLWNLDSPTDAFRYLWAKVLERRPMMPSRMHDLNRLRAQHHRTDGLVNDFRSLHRAVHYYARHTNCSDSRDRVYALLSLLTDEERKLISPDYTLRDAQTFAISTYAAIKARGTLDILGMLDFQERRSDLPSWVVDFSRTADIDPEAMNKIGAPRARGI